MLFVTRHSFHMLLIRYNTRCYFNVHSIADIMLWRCWLGGRKGIRSVKKLEWWGAGLVICLEQGADLHMAPLMPLPLTVSCFSKIQIGFTFLVLAHPGSPGKRAVKRVCVCVYSWHTLSQLNLLHWTSKWGKNTKVPWLVYLSQSVTSMEQCFLLLLLLSSLFCS